MAREAVIKEILRILNATDEQRPFVTNEMIGGHLRTIIVLGDHTSSDDIKRIIPYARRFNKSRLQAVDLLDAQDLEDSYVDDMLIDGHLRTTIVLGDNAKTADLRRIIEEALNKNMARLERIGPNMDDRGNKLLAFLLDVNDPDGPYQLDCSQITSVLNNVVALLIGRYHEFKNKKAIDITKKRRLGIKVEYSGDNVREGIEILNNRSALHHAVFLCQLFNVEDINNRINDISWHMKYRPASFNKTQEPIYYEQVWSKMDYFKKLYEQYLDR